MITSPISKILRYASHESNATIRALSKNSYEDEKRFEQTNRKIDEQEKREELAKTKKQKRMQRFEK